MTSILSKKSAVSTTSTFGQLDNSPIVSIIKTQSPVIDELEPILFNGIISSYFAAGQPVFIDAICVFFARPTGSEKGKVILDTLAYPVGTVQIDIGGSVAVDVDHPIGHNPGVFPLPEQGLVPIFQSYGTVARIAGNKKPNEGSGNK